MRNNRPELAEQKEEETLNSYAHLIMFTHSKDDLNSNSKSSFSILKITLKYIYKNCILHVRVFNQVDLK